MNSLFRLFKHFLSGKKPSDVVIRKSDKIHPASDGAGSSAVPPQEPEMDVRVHHLWCDLSNGLKLQINRTLLPLGESRAFSHDMDASESQLANAIFTIPGIRVVVFEHAIISVEMDEEADWGGIRDQLPLTIRKFFLAGGTPFNDQPPATDPSKMSKFNFGFKQIESRPHDEQMKIVSDLFENEINPAVASHGGFFKLLDIKDNNVYVELGGGCQGCSMANVTLRQGVESRLKEVLPEMVALIDSTDHASGDNPYFSGGKK